MLEDCRRRIQGLSSHDKELADHKAVIDTLRRRNQMLTDENLNLVQAFEEARSSLESAQTVIHVKMTNENKLKEDITNNRGILSKQS